MVDLAFCAHYPFTKAAKELAFEIGISLSPEVVEKAEERIGDVLAKGGIKRLAELEVERRKELSAYACARMIVSQANNRYLTNRYAIAEAKRASAYLESDSARHPEYVELVAADFGVSFEKAGDGFLAPLADYLSYTPRAIDYKLSNREVAAGKVRVKRHERIRILEEAVRKRIEKSLPMRAEFPEEVKEAAKRALARLPKLEAAEIKVGQENYPPCIRKLIEELSMNVNVPHTGRVALAIYLVNAGAPTERIVDYFRHAPDFSEKTTCYQVEYVKNRKYRMPSCATMDSYGACVAECRCGNPLNFRADVHGRALARQAEEKK